MILYGSEPTTEALGERVGEVVSVDTLLEEKGGLALLVGFRVVKGAAGVFYLSPIPAVYAEADPKSKKLRTLAFVLLNDLSTDLDTDRLLNRQALITIGPGKGRHDRITAIKPYLVHGG
jgi:hypothetical protein